MTIQEALDMADQMKPNAMERSMKIRYLSQLDGLIFHEILLKHEHEQDIECPKYDSETDPGTELLVPDPYAEDLYVSWLMSKIDWQNQEMDKYNNDNALFENAYDTMSDWYTRNHMPLTAKRYFRL